MLTFLRENMLFAQVTADLATGTGLPDWLPPVLVTNLALALLVIFANGRGIWVSGREHQAVIQAKDDALTAKDLVITELKAAHLVAIKEISDRHGAELVRCELLRKEEQQARQQAEGRLGRSVEQMNRLAAQLTEIERKVSVATPSSPLAPPEGG